MIRNLVQLAEIFSVLLCMSTLYDVKLKFDIYAVVLIILDVFLFTGINEYGFPGYLAAFSYIGLFAYGILRYGAGTKCALINSRQDQYLGNGFRRFWCVKAALALMQKENAVVFRLYKSKYKK